MATTMFFERVLTDEGGKTKMEIEFGRSSFYRKNLFYIVVDGKTLIMSDHDGREFCEQVQEAGIYLGYL